MIFGTLLTAKPPDSPVLIILFAIPQGMPIESKTLSIGLGFMIEQFLFYRSDPASLSRARRDSLCLQGNELTGSSPDI